MKKLMLLLAIVSVFKPISAQAERIVILDENNNIKQEIYTMPMSTQIVNTNQLVSSQPQTVAVQPQTVYIQPQTVYVQQPPVQEVVVVRQTPRPRTYYYDSAATSLLAGFTGAVIGNAIFHHSGHHHRHHHSGHHRR